MGKGGAAKARPLTSVAEIGATTLDTGCTPHTRQPWRLPRQPNRQPHAEGDRRGRQPSRSAPPPCTTACVRERWIEACVRPSGSRVTGIQLGEQARSAEKGCAGARRTCTVLYLAGEVR